MTIPPSSMRSGAPSHARSEQGRHEDRVKRLLDDAVARGVSAAIGTKEGDDDLFRIMAETVSEILFSFRPDGFAEYMNGRFAERTGMTLEESLGFGWANAIHPDDMEESWEMLQAASSEASFYEFECRLRSRDGAYRWFLVRAHPVFDAGRRLDRWIGTMTDIQDLKDAQSQVERGRERYAAFIRHSSEGIWRYEMDHPIPVTLSEDEQVERFFEEGYLAECNDAMARMYGFESAAEITGARLGDMLQRDNPQNIEFLRAFIRNGYRMEEAESAEQDKDGNPKYFINNFIGIVQDGYLVRGWGMQRDVTRQKVAQQELIAGEERLRIAIDAGQIGAWEWNIIENRITWSDRIYEFHGVKQGEYDGTMESFVKLVHPEDLPRVESAISKAMKNDESYHVSFRVMQPGGDVRWLETSGRVLRDDAGKPLRMLGATMDVTERHEVERRFAEGEERLRFALAASKVVAWNWNLAGNDVSVSDNAMSVLGIDPDKPLRGEDAEAWIHPDDKPAHRETVAAGIRGPQGEYVSLFRFVRPDDGRVIWVEDRGRVTADDAGNLIRVGGIIHDVTERKAAEESIRLLNAELERKVEERTRNLQATLQRIKQMIAHMPMGAVALDEHAVILEINDMCCAMLRLSKKPEEMIGRPAWEFSPEFMDLVLDLEKHKAAFEKTLGEKKLSLGYEIRLKDGRVLLRDYIPIFENGVFHGNMTLYRDVTQERRIDATKSEFMSLASHQLRTPLTAVRWTLGRLEKSLADRSSPFEKRLLEEGRKGAARMTETIDTMLQISRIESGTVQMIPVEIELAPFIKEALHPHHADARAKHQDFRIECPETIRLSTDPNFLKEILCNLISNAVKYTPVKGAIRVVASPGSGSVRIDVSDTGYGIPENQQSKIFRKFFRGDNVVSRDTQGTGLGLYLASLMTKLLQGTLAFRSKEGEGTTFTLVLPR